MQSKKIDPTTPNRISTTAEVFPNKVAAVHGSHFNDNVISLLTQNLVYPYNLPKKIKDFKLRGFTDPGSFTDELHECKISTEDYQASKDIFETSNCKTLRDLHDFYLLTDVSLLTDCWASFNKKTFEDFFYCNEKKNRLLI